MRTIVPVTAILAGIAAGAVARRHRRLAAVPPELRVPVLYVPMSLRDERSLRIGRRLIEQGPVGPVADGVDERLEHVGGSADEPAVQLVVYEARDCTRPAGALLWIHGGGLVMGAPEQGQELCSRVAAELAVVVASVDYRLAPEDPFPAGLEDCYRALTWLHDHAGSLGIDADRIAIGGDSAGGGLAACLAQVAHDRGGPPIRFQLLQYPMLDDRTALRTDHDALVWTNRSNRYAWTAYLGHPPSVEEERPYASAARRTDLSGLPPAWIGIGDIDLFHDEAVDYAERLGAAGVPCELHVVPGMYHAAERVAPGAPSMQDFVTRMICALGAAVPADIVAAG